MRVAPVWALDEEILIIRPQPAASMSGRTACAAMNMLFRLTIIMRSQASSVISRNGTKPVMPALLTRMVTGPSSACARCTPASICAREDTSTRLAMARPPAATMSLAARCAPASSISQTATAAPSRARRLLVARPRPDAAPVTIAFLPARDIGSVLSCLTFVPVNYAKNPYVVNSVVDLFAHARARRGIERLCARLQLHAEGVQHHRQHAVTAHYGHQVQQLPGIEVHRQPCVGGVPDPRLLVQFVDRAQQIRIQRIPSRRIRTALDVREFRVAETGLFAQAHMRDVFVLGAQQPTDAQYQDLAHARLEGTRVEMVRIECQKRLGKRRMSQLGAQKVGAENAGRPRLESRQYIVARVGNHAQRIVDVRVPVRRINRGNTRRFSH